MKKFYEKNEIWFAIICIIIYVVLMGNIRNNFGDASWISVLVLVALSTFITLFIIKNKLGKKYGLIGLSNPKKYLYFIPFILLISVNLWFGVTMQYDLIHQIYAIITMALVGYIEEIIFRGFLFKAIEKDSIKEAIIISAVTFGVGHIVNIFTGHATIETLLQIISAISIGFAFVLIFYKSKSLLPCIITHSLIDISSKFSVDNGGSASDFWNFIPVVFVIVVAGGYALYLLKKVK